MLSIYAACHLLDHAAYSVLDSPSSSTRRPRVVQPKTFLLIEHTTFVAIKHTSYLSNKFDHGAEIS